MRTYIPGDKCPHNISLVRHISFVRCCADIYLQGYMSALYPSSVFTSAVHNQNKNIVSVQNPELKTEEGYSADIVRTYIPGDICPHNVGTMSAQHLTKDICRHNVRTISAQCLHYILLRFSTQIKFYLKHLSTAFLFAGPDTPGNSEGHRG